MPKLISPNNIRPHWSRHIVTLASGTIVAQIVGVAASPFLSRVYSPKEFGIFGSLLAITGIISTVSSLKYEMALVLERNEKKAYSLYVVCLTLLICTTLVCALGLKVVPIIMPNLSIQPELLSILPFGSIVIFCTGFYNIYNFRLNRERSYKLLAKARVLQRLSTVFIQVISGYLGATVLGLIFGNILGLIFSILLIILAKPAALKMRYKLNITDILSITKKHHRFAIFTAPQNLLNSFSLNAPIYFLGYFFGLEVVGSYWFAMRILHLPGKLIGEATHQVFFRDAADLSEYPGKLKKRLVKILLFLLCMISLPTLIIIFRGPDLFVLFFGDKWMQAGKFSQWLSILFISAICMPPVTALCQIYNKQKWHLYFEGIQLIGRLAALILSAILFHSPTTTIACYSVYGSISTLCFIIFVIAKSLPREKPLNTA